MYLYKLVKYLIKYLVELGVDINKENIIGETPYFVNDLVEMKY